MTEEQLCYSPVFPAMGDRAELHEIWSEHCNIADQTDVWDEVIWINDTMEVLAGEAPFTC